MGCVCAKEAAVRDDATVIRRERVHGSKRRASASGRLNPIDVGTGVDLRERDQAKSNALTKKLSNDERKKNQWIPVEPIAKLRNLPKHTEGEQVAAGWPAWLSPVAGEAIKGWIPRRADSFEKLDKIGQGTYSNVYKARDLDTKKIVALKKVRFDNLEPESVRFMAREIQVLRRLDHPNIVKLEGLVTSRMSCSLYLVFEYMEHDLAGLAACPGTAFTEPQVKCYLQQLLRGLDHCHSHEVLHRDIKGSNLLISNSGILKIADFGLATFFRADQKQPLTSRVVTLWYRPPELLLGATDYGVAVDLWSAGCILAELLAGKPIMPGRTEVEQLHKIFKLCGSPSEDFWRKSKLPHATIFKPKQPYRRCLAETYKDFPPSALSSLETLLAIEPADRGTAAIALKSDFFTTKPLACDPSSLPKYPPSKELDAKLRDEEARRQRAAGGRAHGPDASRRSGHLTKAGPAPDANAELAASIQKRRMMAHTTKSKSEKFHPKQEDPAVGFPIDPPRQGDVGTYVPTRRIGPSGNPNAVLMSLKKQKEDNLSLAPHLTSRSTNPLALPAHKSDLSTLSSLVAARNNGATHHIEMASKGVEATHVNNMAHHDQQPRGFSGKAPRIHFSGPLLHPSANMEDMLGEHERQIQQAVRRARQDKGRNQRASKPRALGSSEGASEIPEFGSRAGPLSNSGRRKPPRAQPSGDEIIEICEPEQGLWSVVEHYEREVDTGP